MFRNRASDLADTVKWMTHNLSQFLNAADLFSMVMPTTFTTLGVQPRGISPKMTLTFHLHLAI